MVRLRNLEEGEEDRTMIEINNLTTNPVDEGFLKKIVLKVLEEEGKKQQDLSIAFVGQGRIRKLNKRYRAKNRVTDVLSFSGQKIGKEKFITPPKNTEGLGEVVICLREVKKNAKKFDSSFEKELTVCLIHGILHILGYEHEKDKEQAKKMEEKQKYYLSQQNII